MEDVLGLRLLKAVLIEQSLIELTTAGISSRDLSGTARKGFEWQTEYQQDFGAWPTPSQVQDNIKGLVFPPADEPLAYLCDQVRKRQLGGTITNELNAVARSLEGQDPDSALRKIAEIALQNQVGKRGAVVRSFRQDGEKRFEEYLDLQASLELPGVLTPWNSLNDRIQCWANGQLHVIAATANTGKSWASCIFSDFAMGLGKRVLLVTMEMSTKRFERRLDVLHHKLPWGDFRDAELDYFTERRWEQQLHYGKYDEGDIHIADKQLVQTVSDVTALVKEYEPDLVVVDGGYRFTGEKGRGDWGSAAQIVGDLQTASEVSDVPWVVTTQQGDVTDNSKKTDKQRGYKIRYAREWIIDPDVVIEMIADEDQRLQNEMTWKNLKERDSKGENHHEDLITNWDLTTMNFDELVFDTSHSATVGI